MTTKGLAALVLAAGLAFCANTAAADDPKLPDVKAFDKNVIDSLRAVHNKGAELYNTKMKYAEAYHHYLGALEAVRPLLAHRPDAQKIIDFGIVAADKETDPARKAFVLHETIENVRKSLKVANGFIKPDTPPKKPDDKKPTEKKPEDKKPEDKKPVDKKPKDKTEPAPMPKGKNALDAILIGKVTLAGKPIAAADLTLVSLNLPQPRTFTAAIKNGAYEFAEPLPPAQYAAIVTGMGIPEKYQLVTTSGLRIELAAGANMSDIVLK